MIKETDIAIRELMSRAVVIASPDDTLDKLDELFKAYNIHHLPVVEGNGTLKGIISKGDLERVKLAVDLYFNANDEKVTAKSIMTSQVASIGPNEPIGQAADIFMANIFHALPVVEGNRLIGIITTHDLLKYCFTDEKLLSKGINIDQKVN